MYKTLFWENYTNLPTNNKIIFLIVTCLFFRKYKQSFQANNHLKKLQFQIK